MRVADSGITSIADCSTWEGHWNQVLKPKGPDQDKALGSEVLDKVEAIGGALESLEEQLKCGKLG